MHLTISNDTKESDVCHRINNIKAVKEIKILIGYDVVVSKSNFTVNTLRAG
jgi:hypothetical protein